MPGHVTKGWHHGNHAKIFKIGSYKLELKFVFKKVKPVSVHDTMIMISLALSWLPIFVLAILGVEAKTSGKVAAAWYAGWHSKGPNAFPLSKVSWSKYTHLTYSFA